MDAFPVLAALAALVLILAAGLLVGVRLVVRAQRRAAEATAQRVQQELASEQRAALGDAVDTLLAVAGERLGASQEAGARELDGKKALIDQQLGTMRDELLRVSELVQQLEKDRAHQYGALAEQLQQAGRSTAELTRTTAQLREALASPKARGQWGERMAEDVLRIAGFVEGINYVKQTAVERGRSIPDFTFPLPGERVVHMDVKFPLDNYLRFLDADSDAEREGYRKAFLRDVRDRVAELGRRDYIDDAGGTVDQVLLFIPNEQVYGFIHASDATILDRALGQKVVLCSPQTLFAVLAVIRQAVDHFAVERTSHEILELLGDFTGQWDRFTEAMQKVGTRIDLARKAFDELDGTRRRMLERQLDRIDEVRRSRGLDDGERPSKPLLELGELPVAEGGPPVTEGHERPAPAHPAA